MDFGGGQPNGKSPPKPPNVYGAAEAESDIQNRYIREQTAANRPNQYTPFASTTWSQGGGPQGKSAAPGGPGGATGSPGGAPGGAGGQWSQNVQLAPGLQAGAEGAMGQIAGQAGTPIPTGEAGRQAASDAVYGSYASRLDPMWNQREQALRTNLVNQGLDPNSTAAANAMGTFGRERTDAYQQAQRDAAVTGMGQQQLSFQQDLARRNLPFQQLQQLQGLTQMPGFEGAGLQQAPQYLQAAEALGGLGGQNFGASQQSKGGMFGGLGALGGAAAAAGIMA